MTGAFTTKNTRSQAAVDDRAYNAVADTGAVDDRAEKG